jgi:hypothetical protein
MYIYTCREGHEVPGEQRVWLYNDRGEPVWHAVDSGHMHHGWVANIGENYGKVAMAMKLNRVVIDGMMRQAPPEDYYFDVMTGCEVKLSFPYKGSDFMPLDFDGCGYHEMFGIAGEETGSLIDISGWVVDRFGERLVRLGGKQIRSGKVFADVPGDQLMLFYPEEHAVKVWGCPDTKESSVYKARHDTPFHTFNQHLMGTGYNHINAVVSCSM